MNTAEKAALIEDILMRAAEHVGDITEPTMAAYYARCPAGEAAFEHHCLGQRSRLEGQMVENSLHCLMNWLESPGEIEILLGESVPHHRDTLNIPPNWYSDLIEATAEVVAATIPAENSTERALWSEIRNDLRELIEACHAAA